MTRVRRLALFTGQCLDAGTFALFFLVVPAAVLARIETTEQNPIIAALFALGGFAAVVVVKVGATSLVLWRDHRRPHQRRVTGALMVAAALSGYVGAAFNTAALVTVMGALA